MSQRTIEEYLETIGALEERESPVSTSSIAQNMGLSLASVSEMLRRLSEKSLVEHTPYGGASLTDEGRQRFLKLTRRHRLWEVFLNRYLGIGWEDVYNHACSLEHATNDLVADKLAEFMNNPAVCPHGSPIPKKNLKRTASTGITMANLETGQSAKVTNVIIERNPEFLRYLTGLELTPGAAVKVLEKAPYDGTLTIEVNNATRAIGREAASLIMVKPLTN
ncbi:MAG TPA: metal-dependent transcriptional regulator [Dehalococcoidales bacterium]|nr:metal-dependent transcriptional regulator [Dehalococcoidales bacterium]